MQRIQTYGCLATKTPQAPPQSGNRDTSKRATPTWNSAHLKPSKGFTESTFKRQLIGKIVASRSTRWVQLGAANVALLCHCCITFVPVSMPKALHAAKVLWIHYQYLAKARDGFLEPSQSQIRFSLLMPCLFMNRMLRNHTFKKAQRSPVMSTLCLSQTGVHEKRCVLWVMLQSRTRPLQCFLVSTIATTQSAM